MVTTRSISAIGVGLETTRTFFQQKRNQLRASFARHRVYRQTYTELSSLSERDLNDLGIARCSIKRLAWEAAHEC